MVKGLQNAHLGSIWVVLGSNFQFQTHQGSDPKVSFKNALLKCLQNTTLICYNLILIL